jgi:hypothetical protein
MQRWFPALVIVALLSGQWLHTGILLHFKVRQDVIARTLCIKKDEVQNTCKGQCHLRDMMKEADERQEELPQLPSEEFNVLFPANQGGCLLRFGEGVEERNGTVPHLHPFLLVDDLLRPPQLA